MNIIDNLHPRFRIDAYEEPEQEIDIKRLCEFSKITVPNDYLNIIKKMTEVEILIDNDQYIRIWSASGCIEMNDAYHIQDYIPNSLAIGDDEGGMALIFMTGKKGFGLYKVGFGDLDIDDAEYISASLSELLINGIGEV